jgi:hypothetical protein
MRGSTIVLAITLLLAAACGHLPPLAPIAGHGTQAQVAARCRRAFPAQPWRATHTIFASLPFGQNSGLVGVTAATGGELHAVLLSPEGISLFDGTQGKPGAAGPAVVVHRAVPPFDRTAFAEALMADVGHAYLSPAGEPTAIGSYRTGEVVCRWSRPGEETTDVELGADGPRFIRTYRDMRANRQIELLGNETNGFFPEVRMRVPGNGGYQLDMRLVDHE